MASLCFSTPTSTPKLMFALPPSPSTSSSSSSSSSCTSRFRQISCRCFISVTPVRYSMAIKSRTRRCSFVVCMAPEEEKMTRRSPLDFPIEWERPKPGRRPDIFPQFSPMKTPLPPPMPADPPEEDEEEEEKKEQEEEDPEKEEQDNPDKQ